MVSSKEGCAMNFQGLKTEFINYLKDLNAKEGKHYVVDKGDVSIFMYANEFKDYLKNSDIDCSDVSIFSKSVNELLSMDIKNGKLIDSIDSDSKTEEQNDTEDKTIDDEDFMKDLLTDLMNDNDFKGMLDADESGEVDDAELKNFFNSIKGNDSDENNVSLSDIIQAVTEIENGTFTIENETNSEDIEKTSEEDKKSNETETKNSANTSGATGAGGGGSVGSSGGVSSGGGGLSAAGGNSATGNVVDPNDINNMSLEQLEQEKTTREGAVSDAREAVNDVYSGDNANVAAAQKDYEDAKEDYEEALEDDDKVSDELKEQHEQVISDIENAESEKDSINIKINDTEAKISNVESEISADEANIEALNVSLAALQDSNSEDAASKIAEVQAQISAAEAQKTAHEEEKANLESELDSLQDELSDKENEIEELESQRSDIEDEILKNCSKETKKALETFNKAKENVTSVKESELKTVQADLKVAEADLKEINDAINTKKAEETVKEYAGADGQKIIDFAKTFLGQDYLWGGSHHSGVGGYDDANPHATDCSGLVLTAYYGSGIDIVGNGGGTCTGHHGGDGFANHVRGEDGDNEPWQRVDWNNIQPGDIIVLPGHVVIYEGKNENGQDYIIENTTGGCREYEFSESGGGYYSVSNILDGVHNSTNDGYCGVFHWIGRD